MTRDDMKACATSPVLFAALKGEGFGIQEGQSSAAADGAAVVMLAVVFFVIGMIAVFALTMKRRSRHPDPTLEFLARLKDEEKEAPNDAPNDTPAGPRDGGWERPADWWKKD